MESEKEIRKELQMTDDYDVFYAVVKYGNDYIAYLGKDYNRALEWKDDNNAEIIAIHEGALYLLCHYDAVGDGSAIRIKHFD